MIDHHPTSVGRENVLNLLRLHDVSVDGPLLECGLYDLRKDEIVESHALPEQVPRHLIGRFAAKFGIPMGRFFDHSQRESGASDDPAEIVK